MICALKERAVSSAATDIGISRTHDPWTLSQPKRRCLAYGLLRVCERKNEVKVSTRIKDAAVLGQANSRA